MGSRAELLLLQVSKQFKDVGTGITSLRWLNSISRFQPSFSCSGHPKTTFSVAAAHLCHNPHHHVPPHDHDDVIHHGRSNPTHTGCASSLLWPLACSSLPYDLFLYRCSPESGTSARSALLALRRDPCNHFLHLPASSLRRIAPISRRTRH